MKSDFHVHSSFCDGAADPEEIVLAAISSGLASIGFSGHGYTPYDLRYCMKDIVGYIGEITRLRKKYNGKIQIYLGIEEDSRHVQNSADFDYIIGSCHYIEKDGGVYPFDSNYEKFSYILSLYDGDAMRLCEDYYSHFTEYILRYKPTVIGHFDLVTKFEETKTDFYLKEPKYFEIAEYYARHALRSGSFFELNTGLMSRGYRTSPCPHDSILHIIKKEGGRIVLNSDSHKPETLCAYFEEAKARLRDIGFTETYALIDGEWKKTAL